MVAEIYHLNFQLFFKLIYIYFSFKECPKLPSAASVGYTVENKMDDLYNLVGK